MKSFAALFAFSVEGLWTKPHEQPMYQCECLGMFWRKVWSVVEIESEIFQLFRSEILLLITHGVYGHFFGGLFVNSKADSKKVLSTSCKYPSCHPCFDTKEISVELKRLNQAWYLHKAWLPSLCRTLFGSGGLHASGFGTWYGLRNSVGLLGCDLIFWLIRLSSWKRPCKLLWFGFHSPPCPLL